MLAINDEPGSFVLVKGDRDRAVPGIDCSVGPAGIDRCKVHTRIECNDKGVGNHGVIGFDVVTDRPYVSADLGSLVAGHFSVRVSGDARDSGDSVQHLGVDSERVKATAFALAELDGGKSECVVAHAVLAVWSEAATMRRSSS